VRSPFIRIRSARLASGLSQSELAAAIGVSRSAVAQWEREPGSLPSTARYVELAGALGVNFDWLATGRGKRGRLAELKRRGGNRAEQRFLKKSISASKGLGELAKLGSKSLFVFASAVEAASFMDAINDCECKREHAAKQ
jgi:transcriptional regulator with XRE-family HTH domain